MHTVVFLTLLCSCLLSIRISSCTRITVVNYCKETIWPGITPAVDNATVSGGFQLKPTESNVFSAPSSWHGRIWARTACNFDSSSNATCQTGDCGPALVCSHPGHPPASIAEFALGSDVDYYDVSLVDGFNLPLVVTPVGDGKRGRCSRAGCYDDLRPGCPAELAARTEGGGKTVACRSACDVFGRDEYCCRGEYATPVACLPTNYSRVFKAGCPAAYSFAYDDPTSIVTCSAADYVVAFCPSRQGFLWVDSIILIDHHFLID